MKANASLILAKVTGMEKKLCRLFFALTIMVVAGGLVEPLSAQTAQDLKACQNWKVDPDKAIRTCGVFLRTRRAVGGGAAPTDALVGVAGLRGLAYMERDELDLAIADFDFALALNPQNGGSFLLRGVSYMRKRDNNHALADFDKVIRLGKDPVNLAAAYGNRGLVYSSEHDFDCALSNFNQAIHLNSKLAFAFYGRGLVYLRRGENERAEVDFKAAYKLDPTSQKKYENEWLLLTGWLKLSKGDTGRRRLCELVWASARPVSRPQIILKGANPADLTGPAGNQVRAGDQPGDREGSRTNRAADAARPRRFGGPDAHAD
jgi:Flp pilus assembly protein TadD